MDTGKGMLNSSLSSVHGAQGTDLPVLLPVAARVRRAAFIERREGTYRLNMQRHHLVLVAVHFDVAGVSAQAATPEVLNGAW
jgi:hypothetical protein